MNGFKSQFSSIKDISDRRRLPRLGKIRLGIKMKSTKTGNEFPKETEHFVVPPEIQAKFGEQPKELDVMFPLEDREAVFPQAYKFYGQSRGLKCIGNGETAIEFGEQGGVNRECPCERLEKGECQRRAHLMVIIPKVSCGGIYQIDLGSYHSIVDVNSAIDYVRAMVGRFSWVPLLLKRVPRETHGGGKKTTHYTLEIEFQGDLEAVQMLREDTKRILTEPRYAIPAPEDMNPKMDEGAIVQYTDEEDEGCGETEKKPETEEKPGEKRETAKQDLRPIGEFPFLFTAIPNMVIGTSLDDVEKLLPKQVTVDQANRILAVLKKKEIEKEEFLGKVNEICKKE